MKQVKPLPAPLDGQRKKRGGRRWGPWGPAGARREGRRLTPSQLTPGCPCPQVPQDEGAAGADGDSEAGQPHELRRGQPPIPGLWKLGAPLPHQALPLCPLLLPSSPSSGSCSDLEHHPSLLLGLLASSLTPPHPASPKRVYPTLSARGPCLGTKGGSGSVPCRPPCLALPRSSSYILPCHPALPGPHPASLIIRTASY